MTPHRNHDPDIPAKMGFKTRLHAGLGRMAMSIAIWLRRPVSLGVRLLATNEDGEVLLVRQTYMPGLTLPGGAVEPGETCSQAAVREAFEEAGIKTQNPPELFHVYLNRRLADRDHVVLFVARGVCKVKAPNSRLEISSAGFYSLQSLPDDVTPATLARLLEVFDGVPPSEEW